MNDFSRTDIEALKARVDLVDVIRQSGIKLKKNGKSHVGLCPFHEDTRPSFTVYAESGRWKCFGCDQGGDVLSFVQLREGLSFGEAVERLSGAAPAQARPNGRAKKSAPQKSAFDQDRLAGGLTRPQLLGRVMEVYRQRLAETPAAQEYLAGRGLGSPEVWKAFGIGYCDGSLPFPKDGPVHEALCELGVVTAGGREHLRGCVVVPLEHPDLGVVSLYGRAIDPAASVLHLHLPGPKRGILNWQGLKLCERVVLTEGALDAISVWACGMANVTCLHGVSVSPDLVELLERYGTREVVFCLDGDRAGREAGARSVLKGFSGFEVALPEGKDPNQVLVESGKEALRAAIDSALPLDAPELDAPEPSAAPAGFEKTEDGVVLTLGEVVYRVALRPPFSGRLRVRLKASRGERTHVDKLDLESHRQRQALAVQLVRRFSLSRPEVERHLAALLEAAEERAAEFEEKAALGQAGEDAPPEVTGEERDEALAFLRAPDLIERLLGDMEALGYVGEETGKLLVYLIGISRKLKKPLSGIIRSQSGSGKSSLAELLEQLTPAEDVCFYSRISPMALGWVSVDLKHKLIILEERAGGEAADYQIRTLQSRRRISQLVTIKDPATGQMVADFREVLGPVAFLESTTRTELNPENTTRCYEIFLDESEQQTRRIQAAQRRARLPQLFDPDRQAEGICRRHHNAQRLIEGLPVFIPYAEHLTFPSRWVRTRRDHDRFLCLIEASALLHQHQRRRRTTEDGTTYVLADLKDYRLAYRLTTEALSATFHELSQTARDLWAVVRSKVTEDGLEAAAGSVFTRRDLRAWSGLMDHAVRSAIGELVDMEYAEVVSGSNGKTLYYSLAVLEEDGLSPVGSLTTPEELERLLEAGGPSP